jgi:Flp pilus assembly pilin Flp
MMATIFRLWGEENGHDIAEYALIILVILVFLGSAIWLIGR